MEKRLTADLNVVSNSNLEIQLLDGDLNIIQKLDDEPNDVGGLTSAELKAKFDESGNIIKKYINETLIPAVLAEDATEDSRKQAEAARVAAEQGRVTAEEGRVSAEAARAAAEQARSEAESSRVSAENTRASAETGRVNAESARVSAETERASAEQTRDNSEASREFAEYRRFGAEQERASNESTRVSAENGRVSAENARTTAEQAREAAEQARADENTGIVAQATKQANLAKSAATFAGNSASSASSYENAAAQSAGSASASAQTAQNAASSAGTAASDARSAAAAASDSASQARASAAAAAQSAASVNGINKTAQSWAVGGTGTRPGEDTDNAKYWAEQAQAIASGDFATKNEAQGYVTAHNQSADAHDDIRNALAGKETAGAAAAVQRNLTAHAGNTTVHVTAEQKTAWNGKAAKALSFTVTLTAAGWSGNALTVSNSKFVTSGYAYTVCPAGDSFAGYAESAIYADDVTTAGKMTFHCNEAPTANLTVNILRTEATA